MIKMIEIKIKCNDDLIFDNIKLKNTTLVENSIVIRKLEEIKQELLDIEYQKEFELKE